jgi:hypothetical protein
MLALKKERPAQVKIVENTKGELTAFQVSDSHKKAVAL